MVTKGCSVAETGQNPGIARSYNKTVICTARKEINTYLVTTAATIGKEVVTCRGGDRPPGLLKALNTKYGDELGQLRQQAALHDIHVDHRR